MEQLSGKGTVYSFVNYHRAWHPSYEGKTPYNVSLVDLDEGPRLISNVIECPTEPVKIGMRSKWCSRITKITPAEVSPGVKYSKD